MVLSLLAAWAAAALFYLASPHQTLRAGLSVRARPLRAAALAGLVASVVLAQKAVGTWPGAFVALSAVMLGCVSLPALGLWMRRHVG